MSSKPSVDTRSSALRMACTACVQLQPGGGPSDRFPETTSGTHRPAPGPPDRRTTHT
jgi:hypothetical protein